MNLASAYPGDVLSPLMMAAIVLAVAVGLGAWLILVFLADRQSGARETRQAGRPTPVAAAPGRAAEDEHSEAGRAPAVGRHGAAA
jgi:hypothetical protein